MAPSQLVSKAHPERSSWTLLKPNSSNSFLRVSSRPRGQGIKSGKFGPFINAIFCKEAPDSADCFVATLGLCLCATGEYFWEAGLLLDRPGGCSLFKRRCSTARARAPVRFRAVF